MKPVFEYNDYRRFLKDFYNEKKSENSHFSYRFMAGRVGFKSPGHFTQIIQGKANISIHLIERFAQFLKLNKKERSYFQELVLFNQARKHEDKKRHFERLISFRESSVRVLAEDQYEFYSEWYYTAIREILNFYPFDGDLGKLAKMVDPPVTPQEAKKAVNLLEKLGLIEKRDDGSYAVTDRMLTTGYHAQGVALSNHVLNSLRLAENALDHFPRNERNLSTVSVSVSPEGYERIVEELRAFRRKMLEIVRNDEGVNRAYQFNFQFFPLSRSTDDKGAGE
ncbi:MAG: TIGR02147 family protein [Chitinivibrionales bacterium]|nr:TIGR02147 family protein [Chitinivibrionales bacterium]MBD3395893.1 TIGR02147 family protein [Chitinivibrionales bacterium]